jgi:hypothetical protein
VPCSTALSVTRSDSGCCPVNPATVASPAQVQAILDCIHRTRPELAAFLRCLYYAALRPEEAVILRRDDLILPTHGRGKIILTAACPRTAAVWTSTGTPYEPRGLKHRPPGTIRIIPIPAVLTGMLHRHMDDHGTTPDGRLFRGTRGGILSESVYSRAWHTARHTALGPALAATPLARRPYDLRHAALTLWLNATTQPTEIAARAGNSPRVLHNTYQHCIHSQHDHVSQQIEDALDTGTSSAPTTRRHTTSGHPRRRHQPRPIRRTPTNPARFDRLSTRYMSRIHGRHLASRLHLGPQPAAVTTGREHHHRAVAHSPAEEHWLEIFLSMLPRAGPCYG